MSRLLLMLSLAACAPSQSAPVDEAVVDIRELSTSEHEVVGFVVTAPTQLRVTAVGAEPWPDRLRERTDGRWQDDAQTTWPAAAWILDAKTRAVVWDLRAAETQRSSNGLRRFAGNVELPAGVYEAHYASFPGAFVSMDGEFDLQRLSQMGRAVAGGPYVEQELYKEFVFTIDGADVRLAEDDEVDAAHSEFTAAAIARLVPGENGMSREAFHITRPTAIQIYAVGEVTRTEGFDYGWIVHADTRQRVWTMTYDNTEPAGGAVKNRMANETLRLPPGRYVAYFAGDDSHGRADWNAVPPTDPEFWGLTLRVADTAARAAVRPFDYEPVPSAHTIVSLTRIGDHVTRSTGFTLRRPMELQIYALGEGTERAMVDYAWIVDATKHTRVWTMKHEETRHAGGAAKNRLFEGKVRLPAGSYLVYFTSDDSHSYDDWNAAAPAEARYWGVSVFPASGRLNPADVGPFEPGTGAGPSVAELTRMGDGEDARATFRLAGTTALRIYALGEGTDDEMFDYGWIEDAGGRVVWKMYYEQTNPAGGADKNRVYDGLVTLPAGNYVLRYRSDGSHSYAEWNSTPPDDPDNWGISVFRTGGR